MRKQYALLQTLLCISFTTIVSVSLVACGDEGSSVSSNQGNGDSLSQADSLKYLDYYGMACSADEEGLYKTGKSLVARYPNGSVMEKDLYYKCESGKWTYSDNPGPEEKCTAELEGEISTHTVYSGRFQSDYYYKCESGVWNSISDPHKDVDYMCTKSDTQVGDTCFFYNSSGTESLGMYGSTSKYVYSEDGEWVFLYTCSGENCKSESSPDEVCQKFESKEGSVCTVTGCDWNVPGSSQPRCYADDYFYSEKEGKWVEDDDYEGNVSVAEVISLMGSGTIPITCEKEGKVVKFLREDSLDIYDFASDSSLTVIYGKCVGGVYRHSSEEEFVNGSKE